MADWQEGDGGLSGQKNFPWAFVSGQPVLDLGPVWEISPMACEDEAPEFGGREGWGHQIEWRSLARQFRCLWEDRTGEGVALLRIILMFCTVIRN